MLGCYFKSCRGNFNAANKPIILMNAASRKTKVKEPVRSAIKPPIGGEIVCAIPKASVAAAKLGP